MDRDLVVQAFAAQVYTAALHIAQQVDPVDGLDAHEKRARQITQDVAEWLLSLSKDDLQQLADTGEYLPFERWMRTEHGYDDTAVCDAVHTRLFAALTVARESGFDAYEFIHAVGEYLHDADDHKHGWLAERAANLLAAGGEA